MMTAFLEVLLTIALALLPGTVTAVTISSISPQYGSVAGGTRLTISGTDFGDMYSEMAVVYVGSFPCSVIMHLSSSELLTCETSAGIAGTYLVAVYVSGQDPVDYYGFTYSDYYSPSFKAVSPYAGRSGTFINLYGDATDRLQNTDCPAKTWGDVDCVGSITVGDYNCRQDPSVPGTGINFTYSSTQRYGTYLYSIGCSLPTPDVSNTQTAIGTAKNLNVSIHFEASMRGGMPRTLRSTYKYTADGTPYQFQLYPEVTAITPAVGSNAGGTLLNITGRGFPDLAMDLGDVVNVSIAGVPCTVVNSTYDTIFCVTGPKPDSMPFSYMSVGGLYPGMRGIEYEFYNVSSKLAGIADGWKLNKTITLNNNPYGTGSFKTVLTSGWEAADYSTTGYCSLMKAFFIPPRTSNYSFYVQADDFALVNATWRQSNGIGTSETLVSLSSWTYIDNYFQYAAQRSRVLPLTAGQPVLLESAHCNPNSAGTQQIAVRMEVPEPQMNSLSEKQSIYASSILVPRSVAIHYLYGAGANSTVWTVNVTSSNDTKLNSTSLALELTFTFNGTLTPVMIASRGGSLDNNTCVAGTRVVVLPLLATGADMTGLIEAAFGAANSLGSNTTAFGVLRYRIPGLLSVQIGMDSDQAHSMGLTIALARLVMVPPSAPLLSSLCGNATTVYSSPPPSSLVSDAQLAAATAGMLVILEQGHPTAAVAPGGYFTLRLATRTDTAISLSYDTNATIIWSAINNLTGNYYNYPSAPVTRRVGAYLARVWNATFSIYYWNSVAELVAEPNDRSPMGVDAYVETRRSNPPLTGSFRVAFGNNCGYVDIAVTDAAETVRQKLGILPGLATPVAVDYNGATTWGYNYTVTFDPVKNPGDQPQLRVVDVSGLQGIGVSAVVNTIVDGSTDAFYAPIPTEFLRLAVSAPDAVNLSVNSVPSACADASGICGFQYSDAATPHITGVSPSSLTFVSETSLPLTITGVGFAAGTGGVEVLVGTALCNTTSVTDTQIICNVPDTAPAGIRLVAVNVAGLGFADGAQNITLETLYVTGISPSPAVVTSSGLSVLNFTGKGFDSVNCANNRLTVGGVACGILACGSHFLTVLYPGGTVASAAAVTAEVLENTQPIDTDTPAGLTVQVSATGPTISSVTPVRLPGMGGPVTVSLSGVLPSAVTAVYMIPKLTSLGDYTVLSSAIAKRALCTALTTGSDSVTCVAPALRNAEYNVLAVLSSGLELVSTDAVRFELFVTNVTPNLGSIGGGTTVTITGTGFNTNASGNAVFMLVPVSSTFLNGIVECLVTSATTTTLTCVTQAHMAANADADDPRALKVMPVATQPKAVQVVLCDPGFNSTILRGYCWSLDDTPRASCLSSDPAACNFGYATDLTPEIAGASPRVGYGGQSVSIGGSYMQDITIVEFKQNDVIMGYGVDVSAGPYGVTCTVPDLRPGVYTLLLQKANGELSVDPYGLGVYTVQATITALDGNVGSLSGGLPLSLSLGGAGLALNASENSVTIAGLPCPVINITDRYHLTCRAPALTGYVYAEYWNMGVSSYSMPDVYSFTDPLVARLEKGMDIWWNASSPAPGVIQGDFFVARFTFYYQIAQTENVTFVLDSDDYGKLYVDDQYLGTRWMYMNILLTPGVHKIVACLAEYTGWAGIRLRVSVYRPDGSATDFATVEKQKITPVPPGEVLPVQLFVSGVESGYACPLASKTLQLPNQPALTFEPVQVTIPYGNCGYVYTTYRTPSLTALPPLTYSGITLPTFSGPSTTMNVYGNFLLDPTRNALEQISITILNQTCNIITVAPVSYNGINTTNVTCYVPAAPVGVWPINILVAGLGLTRPTATAATDLPIASYNIRVLQPYNSPPVNNPNAKCYFSLFGGGRFNISGYGFVKGLVNTDLGLNMSAAWESTSLCVSGTTAWPTCQAANTTQLTMLPVASDGFTALYRLTRFKVANPEAWAGNISATATLRYRPRVYNISSNNTAWSWPAGSESLYFCGGRTPLLTNVAPTSPQPDAKANLSLNWYMAGIGSMNNTIVAPSSLGVPSIATVEFEVGPTILQCASVTVTDAAITATTYLEKVSCKMPSYMPAATYTLWLCVQPFGCGLLPAYTVPLTVTGINATTGSSAGGIIVTISGKGFDTNATLVSARFGDSICKITNSTATSVTCVTGSLPTKPTGTVTAPLSIVSTQGTAELTLPAFTFTFDPALESTVSKIDPPRGSTEGGTPVTISGSGFLASAPTTVVIGNTPCTSVAVVSSTTITCTTGKPPSDVVRSPLNITVMQEGRGNARSSAQYQYFDVWSRNSTWGGGPLPGEGDTVVIPAGYTVLLDISPPVLYILVLEGNLVFDDTKDYLNLQVHYIIVKGGNFSIGSAEKPYPGRANITFHGMPYSKDLPQYGAKSLAVRTGVVTFHGLPKIPHYTKLNKTANVNDTSIVVVGYINWQVGDRIVIASSSYYPWQNDEATISGLDNTTVAGCTVIYLDTALAYTHIGDIHRQDGVPTPLDMRAEVAVLTRNIVLTGDNVSAKYQYGMQIMVNTPSYLPKGLVRFDNIEITQSGQAFRLGRYSMHWHLMGDVAWQTWVRGCSIHHTYNRAITVHGTHRAIIQNVTAYHTMGHTFFLEDGIESSNLIEGNIAIYVKTSDALLNTDTTPGAFWITNPNNTLRNNVAVGSSGHGFWYRMLDYPDGPSATTTVCPKFTPLLEFTNCSAHSNMFYGLRVHPEFYPRNVPCQGFNDPFQQVPAVFNGLVAYKNGVKGSVASQMGLVQFINMVLGDNGGGPKQLSVTGKDHGASLELTWVTDDRDRYDIALTDMSGFQNCTIYARTTTGAQGTAGDWPSTRRVTGIISQSPVQGDSHHSALMSMVNMTFVDFTADKVGFSALEACGKCKVYQGGATTFTANTTFIQSDLSKPVLSYWSWGHQGVYLDTDGTLLNKNTLPDYLLPGPSAGWSLGPNATWHSAVENQLFNPTECVYVANQTTSNNGAFCSPALTFRRVMVNKHGPETLKYKNLNVVDLATNRTSVVHFSGYNEEGYQYTVAVKREYWLTWDIVWYRLDPEYYVMHKMDLMNDTCWAYFSSKYVQTKDHFTINDVRSNRTDMPPPLVNTTHGDSFYNRTNDTNSWVWSNGTLNDTKFTFFVAGRLDNYLSMKAFTCPDTGCTYLPAVTVDVRNGTLYWSNISTWNTSAINNYSMPVEGVNVTIPFGWNLVIDVSPPSLNTIYVQGNLSFDTTRDINLTATYIIVMNDGVLQAGSADAPHPTKATVYLTGMRDTKDYGVDNNLNLGSKVLAALNGGTINFYGRRVNKRWIRLGVKAYPGDNTITVSDPNHGWQAGDRIVIGSTSFNWNQSEIRTITAVLSGGATLQLDSRLEHPHGAMLKAYPGGPAVDLRAEVGLLSSNILITSLDGEVQHSPVQINTQTSGELFGAHIMVIGNATGRFDSISMEYCGQAGLTNRSCVLFNEMRPVTLALTSTANASATTSASNPSFLARSSLIWGMQANVRIGGDPDASDPVRLEENVMFEAFDFHSVEVFTKQNTIKGNLVIGTIKDMAGKSNFDLAMPSNFWIASPSNWVTDNVAGGSERYGFTYYGVPCSTSFTDGVFKNNTAHSCLAGMWLQSSNESVAEGCTAIRNFTTYLNWDFGIISTRGIPTDVVLENVNVLDNKHSGITILRKGELTEPASLWWYGGLLAGQSSDDVCTACATLGDPGCHPKLSYQSFNQYEPFSPAVGLQSAQFAIAYKDGPEPKPWDKPKSYALVHGMFNISGVTIADFLGAGGCGGARTGTYALNNHQEQPETFYPHYFSNMNVVNVATGPGQGMFYHTAPNPGWRGELCGEANYTRDDGSVIELTCAGGRHIYWRDLDGTLTGTIGTTAGYFSSDRGRVYPMDQGSPVIPGPCSFSSVLGSYQCVENSTNYVVEPGLDIRYKPKPIPSDGIWGDPQYFVLESRDKDSEDRNFGPVFFNVSGSIDLVTVQMDHGCCFTYKCQKRLSTFATYVPSGQTVYINFTGTPAQIFRLWFPYADPDKEIMVVINYLYTLNRRFVMMPAGVTNYTGRLVPESAPPVIGDGKPHGSYYWDQNNTLMYVKMTGGKRLEVRTENAVQISQTFALTVEQFYDFAPLFLHNLAYAMNISMDRIYIVKVVAGTATATIAIAPPLQDVPELTIADGLEAGDPLPTVIPNTDPPFNLTESDLANLAAMGDAAPKNITYFELILLRQLWAMFEKFKDVLAAVSSETGIVPVGLPTSYIPSIRAADAATNTTTTPPPASSSPPPSPATGQGQGQGNGNGNGNGSGNGQGTVTGNPNSGSTGNIDTSGNTGGGGSTVSGDTGGAGTGQQGKSSVPIGAIIGGVVGGCLIAGVVVLAIFATQRRKAQRLQPSPAGSAAHRNQLEIDEAGAVAPDSPLRRSPGSQGGASPTGSVREAFGPTSPSGTRRPSVAAELGPDTERGPGAPTPRGASMTGGASLAAGYTVPSEPEVLRPLGGLVSTNRQPHSSMPLVPPTAGLASPMATVSSSGAIGGPSRRQSNASGSGAVPKAPAALQRADSASRIPAPEIADNDLTSPASGRASRSVTDARPPSALSRAGGSVGGSRPGSGRPSAVASPRVAPAPPSRTADLEEPEREVVDMGEPPVVAADVAMAPGGEMTPVHRTLDTMESIRPKSRAATGSRPGSGGDGAAAAHDLAADAIAAQAVYDNLPGSPAAPPAEAQVDVRRRSSSSVAPPRPTMQLPGGMSEFATTASLLRSEVAALMVAGGSNASGFDGAAHAVMREEEAGPEQQQQQGSPQAARTPAGLRSDSQRWGDRSQA